MLGIIGGSGFYELDGLEVARAETAQTPYGAATFSRGRLGETEVIFLARHGAGHGLIPSEINYRANIWALKAAGARQVVAVSAVGSLRQDVAPGQFVLPNQYVDRTKGIRAHTFFGDGIVAHISSAQPACPDLSAALARAAKGLNYVVHADKTYVCVEGPRLGTRAESFFLRDGVGADVVGMTNVPEVFLAREAQICYATLAVVTDYDCWQDDPAQHVTVEEVIRHFGESIARAKEIVRAVIAAPPPVDEAYRRALAAAVLTPDSALGEEQKTRLTLLRA